MTIIGVDNIINNINRFHKEHKRKKRAALTKIGVIVKADAVKLAPNDTGNLRSSAFYELEGDAVRIGFTAAYAAWVHEIENPSRGIPRTSGSKKGHYWDAGEPKFLEKSVKRNRSRIIKELQGTGP